MSSTAFAPSDEMARVAPVPALTLVCLPSLSAEALQVTLDHLYSTFADRPLAVLTPDAVPATAAPSGMRVTTYAPQTPSQGTWVPTATDYLNAWIAARDHGARSILVLGPDAASVSPKTLRELADAVTDNHDLALPRYPVGPHDALVNSSILYPLTRALFSHTVRFPLPIDAALSSRMAERLATAAQRLTATGQGNALIWPVAEASVAGLLVREVEGEPRTLPQPSVENLNEVLAIVASSLFADIEAKAAFWQRARLATRAAAPPLTPAYPILAPDPHPVDLGPMIEAFRIAYTNLRELWSLVLPPNSLLSLKKLSLAPAENFQMPDALWARTLFDFLLAFRLRTINRGHLLGALTPLYLAWVASHLRQVGGDPALAEQHIESVATAFENDKPYLVARWRWPDRFNP